jgi:hypothetical protein
VNLFAPILSARQATAILLRQFWLQNCNFLKKKVSACKHLTIGNFVSERTLAGVVVVVVFVVVFVVVVEPLNDAMTFNINRVQKRPIRRPPLSFQGTKVLIPSLADGSQLLQHLKTRKQTVTEHAMDAFISKRFLFAVKIQPNG